MEGDAVGKVTGVGGAETRAAWLGQGHSLSPLPCARRQPLPAGGAREPGAEPAEGHCATARGDVTTKAPGEPGASRRAGPRPSEPAHALGLWRRPGLGEVGRG